MADTIVAIATAPGEGGISIVRLSGPEAEAVLHRVFLPASAAAWPLESHRLTYGTAREGETPLDECMAVLMRAPRSYTREDVAELQLHGGGSTAGRVLQACLRAGARLAEPGEFTRRAFCNGRIDLSQAEAVMALIRSRGEQARQAALRQLTGGAAAFVRKAADELYGIQAGLAACIDYPEEVSEEEAASSLSPRILVLAETLEEAADEQGARIAREGLRVALCGRPNVGKSSLLNALTRQELAIVTPVAGTTRDTVQGELTLGGCLIRVTDTAGMRETEDPVERLGVERALKALREADTVLLVFDASLPLTEEDRALAAQVRSLGKPDVLAVRNKSDLPEATRETDLAALLPGVPCLTVCAQEPESLRPLREALRQRAQAGDTLALTQPRHLEAARRAAGHLRQAARTLAEAPCDLAAVDLLAAQQALAEITGDAVEEKLLDRVFADFCVGK
ncbi:MAG: tRNA uridine-5-carboxymethylaminomethyl(34) synthesis GTPase MnmE [Clostridia bacterium]|nr:tRNA uridine-5-carboxymethylaminomethyl(34) synthesis GTPase MnmE [Clostridia bacterium]